MQGKTMDVLSGAHLSDFFETPVHVCWHNECAHGFPLFDNAGVQVQIEAKLLFNFRFSHF
ncbi:MAG: hypothetical protein JWM44_2451 [Bacilli bacterium]|nr:hypothetical protein [Bacilli bacterium]